MVSKQFSPAGVGRGPLEGEGRGGKYSMYHLALGQMLFPGRSKSYTAVSVRIRTVYSNVLYEPRTTVGALLKLCGSGSIWNKTAVPGDAFTPLTL